MAGVLLMEGVAGCMGVLPVDVLLVDVFCSGFYFLREIRVFCEKGVVVIFV